MIKLKRRFKVLLVAAVTLVFSGAISYFAFAANSSILTDEEKMEYSLNDIMFYQKCPTNGGSSESSAMCGTNQNYAGEQVFTEENLKAIEAHRPFYEKAAKQYGFPWEILAALHWRESGLAKANPTNGQGVYQLYSYTNGGKNERAFTPAGGISDEEFQRQTDLVSKLINESYGAGLDLNTDEGVKQMFFKFNGVGDGVVFEQKAKALGFTDPAEGSSYVMNRYDEKRNPTSPNVNPAWIGNYTNDGEWSSGAVDERWGTFTAYKALTCDGKTDEPYDFSNSSNTSNTTGGGSSSGGSSSSSSSSESVSGNAKKISDTAIKIAWPKDASGSDYKENQGGKPTDAMLEAWEKLETKDRNLSHGADCGWFVHTVVAASGADPEYTEATKGDPDALNGPFEEWVKKHPEKWEEIEFGDGSDISKLRAGDVIMSWVGSRANPSGFHGWVIAELDGELYVVEAGYSKGHNGFWGHVSDKVEDYHVHTDELVIFRAKGGPSCDSCEKGSMNINGAAVCLAWPYGTDESKSIWPTGSGTDLFNEFWANEEGVVKGNGTGDCHDKGAYCCGFSAAVVRYSGYDPNFDSACGVGDHLGGGANQYLYAASNPDLWELIPWDGSKDKIKGGDVIYYSGASTGHSYVIVQDESGEFYIAEASLCDWYGRIDDYSAPPLGTSAFIIRAKNAKNSNVGVSVKDGVKPSSLTGKLTSGTGQGNGDINTTAFDLAWPEDTPASTSKAKAWDKFVEAFNSLPGRKNTGGQTWRDGKSCMVFVNTVLNYAGALSMDKLSSVTWNLIESADWEEVGGEGNDGKGLTYGDLEPGDVLAYFASGASADGSAQYKGLGLQHEAIYGETPEGEGRIIESHFEAQWGHVAPGKLDPKDEIAGGWAKMVRVFRWKKQSGGDECDICAGSDESGDGQLKEGGYDNVEDAKGIIEEYHKTWKNDSPHFGDVCDNGKFAGSPHANCTNFSMWFAYHYMGCTDLANKGKMGYEVADRVYEVCKGKFNKITKSNTPTVYSVVSWNRPVGKMGSSNHTAVVIGINKAKDQIIFADAAWCNNDGRIWEDKLSRYMGNGTYVDISAYVTGVKK